MGAAPPQVGTATVVLGDVARSSRLWQEHPDEMSRASRRLAELLDDLVATHQGHRPREQGEGDNLVAVFPTASDAAAFALALTAALAGEQWPGDLDIGMRIGLHTGDVEWSDQTGYLGPTFNRCARLRDLGHAGMILLSQATYDIAVDHLPADAKVTDLGQHQLRDLSRIEHVYLLHAHGSSDFPPLKSISALPNNLPVPVTSLIGREAEISEVSRLLLEHRLVTLTGAGGSGKTRLAQHVGSEVLQFAPDGAWWVDLMPVSDDERVPLTIAEAVGIGDVEMDGLGPTVLAGGIADKRMLLIIDNCEHVIDAVADICEFLLERCSELRILATSRETLDVAGERGVRVRPLGVPESEQPTLGNLEEGTATQLFLDRATSLDRTALTAAERTSILNICRRLDGIPLAIELAAARTHMLSIADLEAGLDDRFHLLTAGRRGRRSGARQRTLEASIAWSYDLLEEDERAMLCRLAVFPAAFDLEGAQRVGVPDGTAGALDLLTALVDKSLVTVRPADDGRRYRLLESIRHYGLERLRDTDAAEAARNAHMGYTLDALRAFLPHNMHFDGALGPSVDLGAALRDDVRAAVDWGLSAGRAADVIEIHWIQFNVTLWRGGHNEALHAIRPLLDDPSLDLERNGQAHSLVCTYLASAARYSELFDLIPRARELGEQLVEQGKYAVLNGATGSEAIARAWNQGSGAEMARETLERGRSARLQPWPGEEPMTAFFVAAPFAALALAYSGYVGEAMDVLREAIEEQHRARMPHYRAFSLNILTASASLAGLPMPEIDELLEQAVEAIPDDTPRAHATLAGLAGVWSAWSAGDGERAQQWVEHGSAHAGPVGSGTHAMMTAARAVAASAAFDADETIRWATQAAALFEQSEHTFFKLMCGWLTADAKLMRGDDDVTDWIDAHEARLPPDGFAFAHRDVAALRARAAVDTDPAAALTHGLQGVERSHGMPYQAELGLVPVAQAMAGLGRFADAVQVIGASNRYTTDRGYGFRLTAQTERVLAACKQGLSPDEFDRALAAGEAMIWEDTWSWLVADRPGAAADRPVSGWGSLTPTELEVAQKVAEGLTNKQVADALYVTQNTVKTHLKNIYSKLDVGTRAALAAEVARRSDEVHPA